MSSNFLDYRVVSLLNKDCPIPCYCVEDKNTGKLYVWEAVDYGLLTSNGKSLLMADIKHLLNMEHQHLMKTVTFVDHKVAGTLYLVKEHCNGSLSALIRKCNVTNSYVDESFIWKIIYQLGRAAQAMYSRGAPSVQLDLSVTGAHIDQDGNVKLDYWLMFRETEAENRGLRGSEISSSRDGSEKKHKKSDTYSMGRLIYSVASLNLQPQKQYMLPTQYSEELQSLIHLMLQADLEKRPTIESILYHPSLLSQVVTSSLQHLSLPKAAESSQGPQVLNTKTCTKCNELPKSNSSKKDAIFKAKEMELKEREKSLIQKEKQVQIVERLAKEKLNRAEAYLNQARKGNINHIPDDLDSSSYSADTGDTSFLPTAAKLDPTRIVRPLSLALSTSSRRSVRFETIHEEPLKPESEPLTWLQRKRIKYKTENAKIKHDKHGKENKEPSSEFRRNSVVSLAHSTNLTGDGLLETFFR